jgi:lipoprotein-releasing system permease protein
MITGKQWRSPSTLLSLVGMALGVASLVVAMAVVSGFKSTLEETVIGVLGHLSVMRSGTFSAGAIEKEVDPLMKGEIVAEVPFLNLKAVYADKGKIHGVVLEGVEPERIQKVTSLKNMVVAGKFDLHPRDGVPGIVIGKELFEEAKLKVGDQIRLVIPVAEGMDPSDFRSKLARFQVRGVIHFGHYEFDTRYMLTDLASAQSFGEVGERITGVRYKLQNSEQALKAKTRILSDLGYTYQVDTWRDYNRNLFEAADLEKMIIFFVLLVIIVAACFNISATLFVSVVRRYQDIATLKAMGASAKDIRRIFTLIGLFVGATGAVLGQVLGFILCLTFEYSQKKWGFILGSIYKVDHINFEIKILDAFLILLASMLICLLVTLIPSIRGSKLSPAEGLRYD